MWQVSLDLLHNAFYPSCVVAAAAASSSCRIFRIKDPKFAGIAPKECKPMVVPDEEH
jgi:hypothetical protein